MRRVILFSTPHPNERLRRNFKFNIEIIAYYSKPQYEQIFKHYIEHNKIEVRTIAEDEYIVVNY